jgi:heme oxygenase
VRHPVDHRPAHLVLREDTRAAHEDTEASDGMRRLMAGQLDEAGYAGLLRAQLALFEAWEAERGAWLRGAVADAGWAYVSRAGLLRGDLAALKGDRVMSHGGVMSRAGGRGMPRARGTGDGLGIAHIVGSYSGEVLHAGRTHHAGGTLVGAHDVGDPPPDIASSQPHAPYATANPNPAGVTDTAANANPAGITDSSANIPDSCANTTDTIDTAANTVATAWGELYVVEGSALGGRLIARRLRELYPQRQHRFYAVGEDAPSAWRRFQHLLDTHLPDDASRHAAVDGAVRMFARFHRTLKEPTDV